MYVDLAALLNFAVDFLLLLLTNRLAGFAPGLGRCALSAALGGIYGGMCLLPGFRFLGNLWWRLVCLAGMSWIAFGSHGVRRGILFVLLTFALGGAAGAIQRGGVPGLVMAGLSVGALAMVGFRGRAEARKLVSVELELGARKVKATALMDTGNTLHDPLTGEQVLIAGADAAKALTGLTRQQLESPVETLSSGAFPGLRLIPYRAVGQKGAMLLAVRCPRGRIGSWQGAPLVAFAPENVGTAGTYQMLTGGMLG